MACEDAIMTQEQAILAALGQVVSYEVADGQLKLLGEDGAALLTLTAQTSSDLTSVVWRATNYNNGREAVVGILEDTEMTAIFDEDGTLSGSAGCNNYVTGYTVTGNQMTIGPAASTMMLCAEPEGIMEQEAAYPGCAVHRCHVHNQRPGARNAHGRRRDGFALRSGDGFRHRAGCAGQRRP